MLGLQLVLGSLEVLVEVPFHTGDVVAGGIQAALLRAVLAKGFELGRGLVDLQTKRFGAGVLHCELVRLLDLTYGATARSCPVFVTNFTDCGTHGELPPELCTVETSWVETLKFSLVIASVSREMHCVIALHCSFASVSRKIYCVIVLNLKQTKKSH